VQRRRQQDDALDVVIATVLQGQLGAERPADEPPAGRPLVDEFHRGGDVERLGASAVEGALARAAGRLVPRVEAQHGEIGERRQARRGFRRMCESMKPPAVGSGCRVTSVAIAPISGSGQLSDERELVEGAQFDLFAPRGSSTGPRISISADPPAGRVPVPPRREVRGVAEDAVRTPDDDVCRAGRDLAPAARAAWSSGPAPRSPAAPSRSRRGASRCASSRSAGDRASRRRVRGDDGSREASAQYHPLDCECAHAPHGVL
jgi:hypothetical protein